MFAVELWKRSHRDGVAFVWEGLWGMDADAVVGIDDEGDEGGTGSVVAAVQAAVAEGLGRSAYKRSWAEFFSHSGTAAWARRSLAGKACGGSGGG